MSAKTFPHVYRTSVSHIGPIIRVCNVFGVSPPCNFSTNDPPDDKSNTKMFRLYSVFVMALFLGGHIYSQYGKHANLFEYLMIPLVLVDHVAFAMLTVTNVLSIVITVFCYPNKMKLFFHKAGHFERILESTHLFVAWEQKMFVKMFLAFNGLILFTLLLDSFVWMTSLGWSWFKFYLSRNFQYYHFGLTMFLMFCSARVIKVRFDALNNLLQSIMQSFKRHQCKGEDLFLKTELNALGRPLDKPTTYLKDLRSVYTSYNILCELLDIYNDLFGKIILSSTLVTIVMTLYYIVLAIIYSINRRDMSGVGFGLNLLLLCIFWVIVSLVEIIMLAFVCDAVAKSASKIPETCYTFLGHIPIVVKVDDEKFIKEELIMIAQQASYRSPCITAAGFFVVNNSILGFILASITSYIIVVIQFVGQA